MASIGARIRELFAADRAVILHAFSDDGMFAAAFSTGCDEELLKNLRFGKNDRLIKWLLTNETAMIVGQDQGVLDFLSERERQILTSLDVRVCVPLIGLNRLTGLILISSTDKHWTLSDEDLSTLQMLASQCSIAFENAYLYRQQRDRLRKLHRTERLAAAGQLAASLAHEIRNPLTAIRSTVQYLLGEFDEDSSKRHLIEGVIAEVDRIDRTVDGLLHLTRRAEFRPETVVVGELIEEAILLIGTQARRQSVEIVRSDVAPELSVTGDASQLNQLFLNLMLNSLQAMPDGGRLDVRIQRSRKPEPGGKTVERDCAQISIADAGCGISAENIEKVFDPFFTTKRGGTGLGLSISQAIVRQHGGELEIRSLEGEGTTVAIYLPLAT